MNRLLKIGTRYSELAVWQATLVKDALANYDTPAELIFIKSDGDVDLVKPVYEIGMQGVFTKTLDAALLNKRIDIAVHSMKDVPTQLAHGIAQAAVLRRGSWKDILVYKGEPSAVSSELGFVNGQWSMVNETLRDNSPLTHHSPFLIATGSIRRKAQWLHRYPNHTIENLRGNVNTRLKKLKENNWNGAIFAAAGLERINLRPANSIDLDWMLPAPAQGAIMVVCREEDESIKQICSLLHDNVTALCAKIERDFLRTLMGGCSAPIGALAEIKDKTLFFKGNFFSTDGKKKVEIEKETKTEFANAVGIDAANEILKKGEEIPEDIHNAGR